MSRNDDRGVQHVSSMMRKWIMIKLHVGGSPKKGKKNENRGHLCIFAEIRRIWNMHRWHGGIDASAWRNSGRETLKCLRKAIPASSLSWCSSHTRETVRSPWAADFQRVPESVPGPGTGLDRSRNPTGSDQHRIRTSTGFGPEPDPDQHRIRTSTGSGPAPDPDQHRIRTSIGSGPELD